MRAGGGGGRPGPGLGELAPVELAPGQEADLDAVARALADAAYTRVELVEKRGEFAVRGGLLDVFPPTEPHPVRVEFWGDEVDELRYFSAADQRSLDERPERLWAPPCRELLLTEEVRARAAQLALDHPELAEVAGKLAEGIAVEGMESLIPALIGGAEMQLLTDLVAAGTDTDSERPVDETLSDRLEGGVPDEREGAGTPGLDETDGR